MPHWTRCSCGHAAEAHNQCLPGDRWGCDDCSCLDYTGREVGTIPTSKLLDPTEVSLATARARADGN